MNKIKKGRKQWLVTDTGYVNKEYAKKQKNQNMSEEDKQKLKKRRKNTILRKLMKTWNKQNRKLVKRLKIQECYPFTEKLTLKSN